MALIHQTCQPHCHIWQVTLLLREHPYRSTRVRNVPPNNNGAWGVGEEEEGGEPRRGGEAGGGGGWWGRRETHVLYFEVPPLWEKIIRLLHLSPTHISFGWLQLLIHLWSVALSRIDSRWKKRAYLRGTSSLYICSQASYQKTEKHKYSLSLSNISFYTHDLQTRGCPRDPPLRPLTVEMGCGWQGGKGGGLPPVPPALITIAPGRWGRMRKIGERWGSVYPYSSFSAFLLARFLSLFLLCIRRGLDKKLS